MSKRIKFLIFACLVGVLFFWGADSVWALASSDLGMTYGNATGLSATDPRIIIANIIRVILGFLGVLALGLIIYAGFLWMTSNGNQEKIDKAKNILKAAIIGLIIILASFGIATFLINNILSATGNQTGSGPGTGGPTIPTSSPGTTYCDAAGTPGVCTTPDHSMCNINEYCDPSSCTCQPQGGPGDECSASTTACIPQYIQCISDECEPDC
ncbi:MAG TPA: hypothetical protein VKO42_04480, partial [Patescibacteria group bacterium]|nr:hypothetical protein [Patescibacteria group bacterium]